MNVTKGQTDLGILALHKDRGEEDWPYIWAVGGTVLSRLDLDDEMIRNKKINPDESMLYALRVNPRPYTYFSVLNRATKKAVCLLPPNVTYEGTEGIYYSYSLAFLWQDFTAARMDLFIRPGCQFRNETFAYKTVLGSSLNQDYIFPTLGSSSQLNGEVT